MEGVRNLADCRRSPDNCKMDRHAFLRLRRPHWTRLDDLVVRAETQGPGALGPDEAQEMFALYRGASNDLNLVASRGGNPALSEYLETLVARAFGVIATPPAKRSFVAMAAAWWEVVRRDLPALVRRERTLLALAAGAMLAGIVFGFLATWHDGTLGEAFLGDAFPQHLRQTPAERVAEAESANHVTAGSNTAFSSFLFTHNIKVALLTFVLGFSAGVLTLCLLFYNGAVVGALAAMYVKDGVGLFFVAWVGPHGILELPAFVLSGMAGLMLGRVVLRRDDGPVGDQLRRIGPDLARILVAVATLLVLAGFIEGGFSQVNGPSLPYWFKITVAAVLGAGLCGYLFVMPLGNARERKEAGTKLSVRLA